ncbi:MAG: hypothetical protein ACLPKB_08720 [Xanthobacteraceae bacterium]
MPFYPQDIHREIDRKWLDRTARGKPSQPLLITKPAARILKEHPPQRKLERIAKNGQILSMVGRPTAPAAPSTLKDSFALLPAEKCDRGPEADVAAPTSQLAARGTRRRGSKKEK